MGTRDVQPAAIAFERFLEGAAGGGKDVVYVHHVDARPPVQIAPRTRVGGEASTYTCTRGKRVRVGRDGRGAIRRCDRRGEEVVWFGGGTAERRWRRRVACGVVRFVVSSLVVASWSGEWCVEVWWSGAWCVVCVE